MAKDKRKQINFLKPAEQKQTATFKLLSGQIKTLKQSLKKTQDELEDYRVKYFQAHEDHAVQKTKGNTSGLHEILKFVISTICGGLGINFITAQQYATGIAVLILGIILYAMIVVFDQKQK